MAAKKKPAAKRGASRYKPPAKKPVPGWFWLVCGLVIGGFMVFLFSLEPGRDEIKRSKVEQARANQASKAASAKPATQEPAKPKYDFYTLLPESEVILPQQANEEPAVVPPQKPVTPEEAAKIDAARAQAALNGQVPPPPPVVAQGPDQLAVLPPGRFVPPQGRRRQLARADHPARAKRESGVRHRA